MTDGTESLIRPICPMNGGSRKPAARSLLLGSFRIGFRRIGLFDLGQAGAVFLALSRPVAPRDVRARFLTIHS